MRKLLLAAAVLAAPLFAVTAARAQEILAGPLIEALAVVKKAELSGVFTYIGDKNGPSAFADLIARDPKAMKRYSAKLKTDMKAVGGLTAWDHQVCATLVNAYAGVPMPGIKRPGVKQIKVFNDCVLSTVMELSEIVTKRNK